MSKILILRRIQFILILLLILLQPVCAEEPLDHASAPVIVFISFSMPDASIKATLDNAARIKAPVLIRGLIDHSFKKTLEKIYTITQEKKHSLQIDPEMFKQYQIDKVPAVVIRDVNLQSYWLFYGDVVLEDLLALAAKDSDVLGQIAKRELIILRQARHV